MEVSKQLVLKQRFLRVLRRWGLLGFAEECRYWYKVAQAHSTNRAMKRRRRGEVFPPYRIAYDAYSHVDYENYYTGGRRSAEVVLELLRDNIELRNAKILEWGCGPGRIVRHLSEITREFDAQVYGTDYNSQTIKWCTQAIPQVRFASNGVAPPLPFPDSMFDAAYCSSVFTHLSAAMHYAWLTEIVRVLKPNGVFVFTTQGNRMRDKLLPDELLRYDDGQLVVRQSKIEGSRTYSAYQSEAFVLQQFVPSIPGLVVVGHDTHRPLAGIQDIWIVRKT